MTRPSDGTSIYVGVTQYGAMFGRSRWWARAKLEGWLAEQNKGGPKRVWEEGKRLFTTLAIIQRDNPHMRDQVVMRKLKEHDRDLDRLAQRVDDLTTQLRELRRQQAPRSGARLTG